MAQEQKSNVEQQVPEAERDSNVASPVEEVSEPVIAPDSVVSEEQASASATDEEGQATATAEKPGGKKKIKVSEQSISPRSSLWPFLLAFAIAVLLFGIISNLVVLGLGIVFVVACIIGWALERR